MFFIKKFLYRFKQSGKKWYIKVSKSLKILGFEPLYNNLNIFRNLISEQFINLYINNIIILGKGL